MEGFAQQIELSRLKNSALVDAQHAVGDDDTALFWTLCHWPVQLTAELSEVRARLTRFRTRCAHARVVRAWVWVRVGALLPGRGEAAHVARGELQVGSGYATP